MSLCQGCFEKIRDGVSVCPVCGYYSGEPVEKECFLIPGTKLSGRYSIGKVMTYDHSSITYIALDNEYDLKVKIIEFFPEEIVARAKGSNKVVVNNENSREIFDNGFAAFVEKAKMMFHNPVNGTVYDCIAENDTAYIIMEYPKVSTSKRDLQTSGSESYKSRTVPAQGNKPTMNVIKPERKEKRPKTPLWVKILIPVGIVFVIAGVITFMAVNHYIDLRFITEVFNKDDETTESSEETEIVIEVNADVMDYGDHSYACFNNCDTWEDAEEYCESLQGHLVVINSREENDAVYEFITTYAYDNVFIGYSDCYSEGSWVWVNGEASDYTNWYEGEPNGFTPDENYAVFNGVSGGYWSDSEFSPRIDGGAVSFICEWDFPVSGSNNIDYNSIREAQLSETREDDDIVLHTGE